MKNLCNKKETEMVYEVLFGYNESLNEILFLIINDNIFAGK